MLIFNSGLPRTSYGHVCPLINQRTLFQIFRVVQDMLKAHHSKAPWALKSSMTLQSVELGHKVSRSLAWLPFRNMQALAEKSGLLLCFKALF